LVIGGYFLLTAVLSVGFYAFPGWHMVLWSAIALASAAAMALGIRRHRPRRRTPWVVLAVGVLTFAAGDTTYNLLTTVFGQQNPFPSYADLFYLVTCVLVNVGMVLLVRSMTHGRDRSNLVDAVILTLGVGLLDWIFLINPYVVAPDLTLLQKAVSIAYPLSDVLLLATVFRVLGTARRSPTVVLLGIGCAGLLFSDVVYGLGQLNGSWQIGGPIDLGWIALYACWGLAALHPSMVRLTEPRLIRQGEVGWVRLTVLGLSAVIAPAVLLIETLQGNVRDGVVIAVLSALIFALVLVRLTGVVNRHRQALTRERGLREAASALLLASDVDAVALAVRIAVGQLLPAGTPHEAVFAETSCPLSGEATQLVSTERLDPALRARVGRFPIALCCPLTRSGRPHATSLVGSLVVAAPEHALAVLHWPAESLAAQAALALERIALTQEINRRIGEDYFRTLVQNNSDLIFIVDDQNRIRYASPSATAVFDGPAPAGYPLVDLVEFTDRLMAVQLLDLVRSGGLRADAVDWRLPMPDGGLMHVEVSCRDLRADPTVRGLVVTMRDVTERRRLERELTLQAFQDPLTGLPNRVLFQERAGQAVARSQRTGRGTGVVLIDLDDFKELNDTLGHAAGDELLAAVGARLADALGPEYTTARLGGDEFGALVEDVTTPDELERLAERTLVVLAEPLRVGGQLVHVRASIGFALAVEAADGEDLVRQADLALYAAKGAGKAQWRRYQSELHTAAVQRLLLRAELERAVEQGEFAVHFQPIVALDSGRTAGFEALVRWAHPDRGLLAPENFIGAAEESGLIVPMGAFVLHHAIVTAAQWYRECLTGSTRPPYVSVNVSARQFRALGFVDSVRAELAECGLPPHLLMLEITESLLLRDDDKVWADLQELRSIGVRVAIDDFGTGYSSLSYLRQVPIELLKIDKSFVDTASSSPRQQALVEGIVRLADALGLVVVAEGIERDAERDLLVGAGCKYGQGYLFARPMLYEDTVKWLFSDRVAA
jgi:diguanylate cyclase (GGDEF)-like protein/PAS domain S-box-containing protein